MLSERALSKVSKGRRIDAIRRHSHSCIPSEVEATQRESHLRYFHLRNVNLKRNNLENVCRQNYRIYFSINQQKSSLRELFASKRSVKHRSKENILSKKINQQKEQILNFKSELSKVSKLQQILKTRSGHPTQKRQGARQILQDRVNQFSFNHQLSVNAALKKQNS